MRKAILISALALGMAGCAASSTPPQVRDLSMSREGATTDTVSVETGDTLYGIAWRHNIDFRELARLNGLAAPYRLEPGQQLRLTGDAQPAGGNAGGQQAGAAVAGAMGAASATVSGSDSPDWLAPDTQAIENNRRLTSQPLADQSSNSARPTGEALAAAGEAGGSDAPGPIYNYDTPGADGQLSERDRAEREALARERERVSVTQQPAANEASTQTQPPSQAQAGSPASTTQPGATSSTQPSTNDTTSSSNSRDTDVAGNNQAAGTSPDAGTAVAGETQPSAPRQRTFQPVENIEWQWPVDGQVTGRFGEGADITAGIDIAGQKGQPVKAAGAGIVVYAGDGVRGYGNLILLKHNDHFLSAYAHNDSLRVQENDVVEAGEVIATMGDTDADGVKLHFEVRQDGQPQDPLQYLPQR